MGGLTALLLLLVAVCAGEVQSIASAQVEFSQSYYVVSEEEGWVEVDLTATGPVATSYTVQVTTKSGSARRGVDFAEADYSVIIEPGMTTAKVYIAILNDATTLEGDEQFTLALKDTSSSRDLGVSVDAASVAMVTIIDNDIVGVEFDCREYSIHVDEEELILQLTTTEKPDEHFLVHVNLKKGSPTNTGKGTTSLKNVDRYIAFFRAGETTSKLHIPVKEVLAGARGGTVPVSLSIPDVSYSLGVRASVWDTATITITGELPYDPVWYLLEDDSDSFRGERLTRQADAYLLSGSGSGIVDLGVCDEPAPAHPVSPDTISANSVEIVFEAPLDSFDADLQCLLRIQVANAVTAECNSGRVVCSADSAARRRRRAIITFLPGHVIITNVVGSGANETTVTLYVGLPLSATPLDPSNPIVQGNVTTIVVQGAEVTIESALGVQVVDDSIMRAPNPEEPTNILDILSTALLLAIIIPVVVGVVCLAGLAGLLLAIVIVCVVKKKKAAVAPIKEPGPVLGTHMPTAFAASKEMLVTDCEHEVA